MYEEDDKLWAALEASASSLGTALVREGRGKDDLRQQLPGQMWKAKSRETTADQ